MALTDDNVARFIGAREVKKTIVIKEETCEYRYITLYSVP